MNPSRTHSSELNFEIGHVLFTDIVGYSKLLITQQSEQIETLKAIVRNTKQVRLAEAKGKLLRLPTGDGMALVFRTHPESPTQCAPEISQAVKAKPDLRLRMGVHSGPVREVADAASFSQISQIPPATPSGTRSATIQLPTSARRHRADWTLTSG